MSTFFSAGDIVYLNCSTDTSGQNTIALPENNITPLEWGICDLGADDSPTVYIPYRVYVGDSVIVRATMEGAALIPEETCVSGSFTLTGDIVTSAWATETLESSGYRCPGASCPYYGTYKVAGTVVCPAGGQDPVTGFLVASCSHLEFKGFIVYGSDSRTNTIDWAEVISQNAYEYVEFETSEALVSTDSIHWHIDHQPPYAARYSAVDGETNTYRLQVYPGHGGYAGLPSSQGGYAKFCIYISVGDGYGSVKYVSDPNYTPQSRTVTITLKNTGRYGNYQ